MQNIKKQDIIDSANVQGFNLEYKAYDVLHGMMQRQSSLFKAVDLSKLYDTVDGSVECDVFACASGDAYRNEARLFYLECKGSSNDTKLFLIEAPKAVYEQSKLQLTMKGNDAPNGKLKVFSNHVACATNRANPQPFFTINGDFFVENNNQKKPPEYKPTKDKSNLFKGVKQLEIILNHLEKIGFSQDLDPQIRKGASIHVFPIIVVSSDIYVVRYGIGGESEMVYGPVPWVGYRSNMQRQFISCSPDGEHDLKGDFPVYFSIVNVQHLEDFFKQIHAGYKYLAEIDMVA